MARVFFPYTYFDEELDLWLNDLTVDGQYATNLIDSSSKTVYLENRDSWNIVKCNVTVRIPDHVHRKITASGSQDLWHVLLVVKSMSGSGRQIAWRKKLRLEKKGQDNKEWEGSLELDRNEEGPWVQVQAFITRSEDVEDSSSDTAHLKGQRIASSTIWLFLIDPLTSPFGQSIRVEWKNFREDSRFEKYPTTLHCLDFSEEVPVLYLNDDEIYHELKVILNLKGYSGIRTAVRDVIFSSIAQPIWLSLILNSISEEAELNGLSGWKKSVIEYILPDLFPGAADDQDAYHELQLIKDNPEILLPKLLSSIQKSINIERSISRLLNSIIGK